MGKSCQVVGEHGMQSDGIMPGTGRSGALPVEAGAGLFRAGRRNVARTGGSLLTRSRQAVFDSRSALASAEVLGDGWLC